MNIQNQLHLICTRLNALRIASILVLLLSAFGVTGTANAQGVTLPAEINKSFTPLSIVAGQVSVLKITIFNPNVVDVTNASWTDNLIAVQSGLRIANPAGVTNTCGGTVSANPGSTTISLSGGTVPKQVGTTSGSCTVSVNITSFTSGSLINRIPSGALTGTAEGEPVSNTDPASATLNVTGTPTPTVNKSFNPGTIWAGATSRLTIAIKNNLLGTSLTGVSITDDLPANVFLADPVNPVLTGCGSTPPATLTAGAGGSSILLQNATIAPNATCNITVSVTSDVQGQYTNTIPANTLETDQDLTNTTSTSARLNVDEIRASKQFSLTTISPGVISILTITLENPTTSDYTGVTLTDDLPAPMIVAASPAAVTTCGGNLSAASGATSIVLTNGVVPLGSPTTPGSCTITVPVTVPVGTPTGTLTNRIDAGDLTTEQGVGNSRSATANITVLGTDLLASKSFSPSSIRSGENSRLRLLVTAPLDTNLTNFSITDELPENVRISNFIDPVAVNCGSLPPLVIDAPTGERTITVSGGTIEAGQQCRIDVYVTGSIAGSYQNIIPPANITNDQNRRPAASLTSTLNVSGGTTLSIDLVKGFDPLLVTGGAVSTLSVELINPGTATLTGIGFTDTMPTEMILANPVNFNTGTCGGTLTGSPGSNVFQFSGGTLPPQGTCTLTMSATMTVNGNLTNVIGAGAVRTDQEVTNPRAVEASLTNLPGASVTKAFDPSFIPANSYSILTITIQNTSNIELVEMGMTDTLPDGLVIAGGSAPAPTNQCGGTFTAVPATQLIELIGGNLAGSSSCIMTVPVTGSAPGEYINNIPVGGLRADPNVRNNEPATAPLTITASNGGGGGTPNPPTPPPPSAGFLIPVTGFKADVVTDLKNVAPERYSTTGDVTLEVPSLGIKIPIVGVPKKNGTWNVSWLGNEAGWLEGSAFPSWSGNSVLTSHVYLSSGLPGPFVNLNKLKFGDRIIVHAYGQKYIFEVQTNTVVEPTDKSVMKHEEKSWLTLITCKEYDEATKTYKKRVVIRAVLVKVEWE